MEETGTPREREATFAIISAEPEAVAATITELRQIADFSLLPGDSKNLVDTYFDTCPRNLTVNRWALRVRCADSRSTLTLKGPSKSTVWGGLERLEIEVTWSKEALERAVAEMALAGITALQATAYCEEDPVKTLKNCGFEVIQSRELWRRTRLVLSNSFGTTLAELSIDRVRYCGTFDEIVHWEVELEALLDSEPTAMPAIIGALLHQFGPALRLWPYSKLATGLVIEELLEAGLLQPFIRKGNQLTAAGYERLDEHIRKYV